MKQRLALLAAVLSLVNSCVEALCAPGSLVRGKRLPSSARQMAGSEEAVPRRARLVKGFSEVSTRYDGFILDQFGVMHNGVLALPGASECYANLAASGKKIVILSNTSRRAANGGPCKT